MRRSAHPLRVAGTNSGRNRIQRLGLPTGDSRRDPRDGEARDDDRGREPEMDKARSSDERRAERPKQRDEGRRTSGTGRAAAPGRGSSRKMDDSRLWRVLDPQSTGGVSA